MKALALLIGCAACATSGDPYPVVAAAELDGAGITGPLEVLGANVAVADDGNGRTVAAYRMHLPDGAPRHVRIYNGTCAAPEVDMFTHQPLADLGEIRRVGSETHFFVKTVRVGGRLVDVDTETIHAAISMNPDPIGYPRSPYVVGRVAIVHAADLEDGSPGAQLACGVVVATEAP